MDIHDRWAAGEWRHHGVSQAAFANLVGVRPTTVTRWKSYPDPEKGKARPVVNAGCCAVGGAPDRQIWPLTGPPAPFALF